MQFTGKYTYLRDQLNKFLCVYTQSTHCLDQDVDHLQHLENLSYVLPSQYDLP